MNSNKQPSVRFRVLIDNEVRKINLPGGIPSTVDELVATMKEYFTIPADISLQYRDEEFDDFFNLTTTNKLKDKDTLKIVYAPLSFVLTPVVLESSPKPSDVSSLSGSVDPKVSELSSLCDSDSQDTIILSPSPSDRQNPWPALFPIPTFSHNTELALTRANDIYLKEGTPLTSPSVKSDILEHLAEAIFAYTAYPNYDQRYAVVKALVMKHPCLKEPGSLDGVYGWEQSLKYKCANYRTKRRALGSPEVLINSLQKKTQDEQKSAKNIKKPKRAEVNYLPPHPSGETDDTLESLRLDLIEASKQRDPVKSINYLMARTYSWRRQEVVTQSSEVSEFQKRWPTLFNPFQINEEFRRCTAVSLESTFMSQLDKYSPKLLELFSAKGGASGQRMKKMLMELIQDPVASAVKKRDVVLRCLIEFMGESGDDLISDFSGRSETSVHEDLIMHSMRIYVCHEPDAVGIILEGIPVLTNVGNLARACCLLFGLTYALNLQYPSKLAKTFEVFQRLFMGLDTMRPKPTARFMALKNKLVG